MKTRTVERKIEGASTDFRSFMHKDRSYVNSLLKNRKELGKGMFGVVYKTRHHELNLDCAVKKIDLKSWQQKSQAY
jgi:serine/threonine protein kinase